MSVQNDSHCLGTHAASLLFQLSFLFGSDEKGMRKCVRVCVCMAREEGGGGGGGGGEGVVEHRGQITDLHTSVSVGQVDRTFHCMVGYPNPTIFGIMSTMDFLG